MLIWLASYPRSGNTYLRILLNRLYGFTTTTGYDDNDPVAQMVGPEFVGYRPRRHALRQLVGQPDITTHCQPHMVECGDQPALYLVRDGRDAVTSFAFLRARDQQKDAQEANRHQIMHSLVTHESGSTGNWGLNVLTWLRRSPPPVVIRFERLIREPERELERALAELGIEGARLATATAPNFHELKNVQSQFFRRGVVGSYRDEMPEEIQDRFWKQPHNAEAMALLGYDV